jgi:putative membrane protein
MRLLLHWILSATALWIVAHFVPGIYVSGPKAALIAALVIGLINATLGLLLKILTFPLTILTLGLFWFVINALMLELAANFVNGFQVRGFIPRVDRSGPDEPGQFGSAMDRHAAEGQVKISEIAPD